MPDQRSSIDEQVVKMSFDNSNFDSNINDSIKALNNLDTKLGLLNKEDFADLKNNISNLANVFTVKGQIMLGVFTSLGKKIVDVGLQLKNKLFAGIKDGLSEYNMIIDSTQTIYQNVKQSGATIDDVNKALDQLNDYADLTIYNFSEMTRMIGMFTSAGVSLKKSVATIKGLANAAALVGANSEKAQVAWQAVSRAMSSGQFTNVVWRSLELSNIAGEQFNRVITEVARANNVVGKSGKNIDEMIEKYGSLRLTLSEGWLTKDIFAEAMQIMSNDLDKMTLMNKGYTEEQADALLEIANSAEEAATQVKTFKQLIDTTKEAIGSGWAQSFRILIGDLDRAKRMFSRVSIVVNDFIDNNAKIRNELFSQIVNNEDRNNNIIVRGLKTGQYNFQQTIENMMAVIKTFFKSVATGFLNIFPIERISAAALKVVDTIEKATRALVLNKEQLGTDGVLGWDTKEIMAVTDAIKDLIRFFRGLASAVDIAWMAFSQPIKAIVERIPFFQNFVKNTNSGIIGILKNLGNFGDKITVIRNAFKNTRIIERFVGYIIDHFDILADQFPVLGAIVSIFKGIKNGIIAIKEAFQKLDIKPLSVLFGAFKFIVEGLWNALNFVFGLLRDIKNKVDWSFLDGPKEAIIGFIKKLSDYGRGLISFKDLTGKIGEAFKNLFGAIANLFSKNKIKTGTGEIQKSFTNFGDNLTTLSEKIKKIGENVKKFLSPIAEYFKNADWSLEGIVKKIGLFAGGIGSATLGITVLAKELGKRKIVDNINELLSSGIDVVKAYQKQIESKMILNIAFAIGILAGSMLVLSLVPYEKLENGLVIFSSFMATIALTLTPVITALAKFNESLGKTKKVLTEADVLNNLVNKLGKMGQTLANSLYNKMLGEMLKDLAISILILVGAIAALVLMFTLNADSTERAVNSIINLIVALSGAVFIMAFALEALSRAGKQTKTASDAFKMFFTLSGIAAVITSIALAIAILVASMAKLATIDHWALNKNMDEFREVLWSIAGISAGLLIIIGVISKFSEFKSTAVGIPLIILSIAAAVAILSYSIAKIASIKVEALDRVFKNMMKLVALVGLIAFVITGTIGLTRQLKEFTSSSVGVIATLAAVTGMIYVLSKIEHIDDSVIATISILTGALTVIVSVLSLLAIITAKGSSAFSTDFVRVIKGISLSIAAVIASVGLLTAGVAALIASLSAFDLSDAEVNRASSTLVIKLKRVAETIRNALPELSNIFYNLGVYVGTMFTSFTFGFIENVLGNMETLSSIADKLVNLVIDVLNKVFTTLQNRKSDIKQIIYNVVDLIGAIITEVLNDVFKKNSANKFTEEDVLKMLGFGGLTIGAGSALLKIAANFNTTAMSVKNLSAAFKYLTEVEGLSILDLAVAVAAIVAAVKVADAAAHGLKQLAGEEAQYMRYDIQNLWDFLIAFFTDTQFRSQTLIYGVAALGQLIVGFFVWAESGALSFFARVVKFWSSVFQPMIHNFVSLIKFILEALAPKITKLASFISTALKGFTDKIGSIINLLSKAFPSLKDKVKPIEQSIQKIANTCDKIPNALSKIPKILDKIVRLTDLIPSAADKLESFSTNQAKMANEIGKDPFNVDFGDFYTPYYNAAYNVGANIARGEIEGYDSLSATLSQRLTDTARGAIESQIRLWRIASPSKTMADIYKNVMLGAIQGMKSEEESYYAYIQRINSNAVAIAAGGAEEFSNYLPDYLKALNGGDVKEVRNVKGFERTNNNGDKETVDLNQQYLELIIEQKDALQDMSLQEQRAYLEEQIRAKGMKVNAEELGTVISTILMMQSDQTKMSLAGIEALDNATMSSVIDVWGKRAVVVDTYLQDEMEGMNFMVDVANDNKDKIIGKKKEEVVEILKQEAMKRGMTEATAEEMAKNLVAIDAGTAKTSELLSADELDAKVELFGKEYNAYYKMKELENDMAQASKDLRVQLALQEYHQISEAMSTGAMDPTTYQEKVREARAAGKELSAGYDEIVSKIRAAENPYQQQINQTKSFIKGMWADSGMTADEVNEKWNQSIRDYTSAIDDYQTSQKDRYTSIFDWMKGIAGEFTDYMGQAAGDLNLGSWNFGSGNLNDDLGLGDDDISSAVDAASDLKDGLESQRADLTPTFDLDQLASDANKATGIVMSSLMAAQNASIGDYINKDSELNPFMKDRWQNVYNFTQNNYSPKALSRIDIYRQTQRQISMSRGF